MAGLGDLGGHCDGRGQSQQKELMVPLLPMYPLFTARHISQPPLQLGWSCDPVIAKGM